jgi:hypothetical protein
VGPPDIELRVRLRELANQRRRFGYRRLFILLRDQDEPSGLNRIYRPSTILSAGMTTRVFVSDTSRYFRGSRPKSPRSYA